MIRDWPALRTRPGASHLVSWGEHALAAGIALMITAMGGFLLMGIGGALSDPSDDLALMLMLFGAVFGFSIAFGWVGFLIGVPLTRVLLDMGWAGYLVLPIAGVLVGYGVSALIGSLATVFVGPVLACFYAIVLKIRVPEAFVAR